MLDNLPVLSNQIQSQMQSQKRQKKNKNLPKILEKVQKGPKLPKNPKRKTRGNNKYNLVFLCPFKGDACERSSYNTTNAGQMNHELASFPYSLSNPDKFHARVTAGPNGTARVVAARPEPQR